MSFARNPEANLPYNLNRYPFITRIASPSNSINYSHIFFNLIASHDLAHANTLHHFHINRDDSGFCPSSHGKETGKAYGHWAYTGAYSDGGVGP